MQLPIAAAPGTGNAAVCPLLPSAVRRSRRKERRLSFSTSRIGDSGRFLAFWHELALVLKLFKLETFGPAGTFKHSDLFNL